MIKLSVVAFELSAVLGVVFGLLAAACAFVISYNEYKTKLVVSRQRDEDGTAIGARDVRVLFPGGDRAGRDPARDADVMMVSRRKR